jgi:hypothetical protein
LARDNDWLCKANESKLMDLIPVMEQNNIDRLALYSDGIYDHSNEKGSFEKITLHEEDYLIKCKTYYNFSYMPSIYNKNALAFITTSFLHLSYREFETSTDVQHFAQTKLNVYSTYSTKTTEKTWGLYLVPYFEFIHIFYRGKWILSSFDTMINEFNNIIKQYNIDINKRLEKDIKDHN